MIKKILKTSFASAAFILTSIEGASANTFTDGYAAAARGEYVTAYHLWTPPAEHGNADAQYRLGHLYDNGLGVSRDYDMAGFWYRKAADQGNAKAQLALGIMCHVGKGVSQDDVTAYKWFDIASANGSAKAVNLRSDLAKFMSTSQIAEAKQLSQRFLIRTKKAKTSSQYLSVGSTTTNSSRKAVASVQQALKLMGYYVGAMDGLAGPKTHAAIKAFQRESGVSVDGILDRELVGQLELLNGLVKKKAKTAKVTSTGSGFIINQEGYVVTNYHVVDGCNEIKSPMLGSTGIHKADTKDREMGSIVGNIVATDPANDLAVINFPGDYQHFARFRDSNRVNLGEPVVVAGFPLRGLLADDLNVVTGEVSATSGFRGDAKHLQISAPVQQGNSGGPLLDQSGNVVGVVVSKLDAIKIAEKIGTLPQNVNFAIKAAVAKLLLDINNVDYKASSARRAIGTAEIADQARKYTVVLECWK